MNENFINAELVKNCRKIVIDVKDHKTILKHGAAQIIIDEIFYDIMLFYYEKIRQKYDLKRSQFFISREGKKMNSAGIVYCAKSAGKVEGIAKKIM